MRALIIIFFLSLFFSFDTNAQTKPSEESLKNELKSIKKSKGSKSLEYIKKLTELSIFYTHLGDYKNAFKQIEKADILIQKKLEQLQLVKNNPSFRPKVAYPLAIKILATKCRIYKKNNQPSLEKGVLNTAHWIDYGLQLENLKLVEVILGALFLNFDFSSSFFQEKWSIACTLTGVPKELRFLKYLEHLSKLNLDKFPQKHDASIINLAVFYKKNRFQAKFDSIKTLVDEIAPDTLSKMEINTDQFPRFPGCEIEEMSIRERKYCADQELLKFIYSNIKSPKEALDRNISGRVIIEFTVTEKGEIKDAYIFRDIGGGCGEEALRIVNLMNSLPSPWIHGIKDDKLLQVTYKLPIAFNLGRR